MMRMINIDGPDGSGKTTLINGLLEECSKKGYKCDFVHFPRYDTELGKVIKKVLLGEIDMSIDAFQMLCSADRRNWSCIDYHYYFNTDIIFVDRHTTSAIVYGSGLEGVKLEQILSNDVEVIQPDAHIILIASPDTCMNRMNNREGQKTTRFENFSSIEASLIYFKSLQLIYDNVKYIDAEKSIDEVLQDSLTYLKV